jgi:hypothetical protein
MTNSLELTVEHLNDMRFFFNEKKSVQHKQPFYLRPKFTFIVVQKRGNTRFFRCLDNGSLQNPPVGTVVDHTIVKQESTNPTDPFDFYLISQETRLGTVTPTHYFVLTHPGAIPHDRVQQLTYRFNHLYYNWPVNSQLREKYIQIMLLHVYKF